MEPTNTKRKKVVAVIQVRMGSTRLPKKVQLPMHGKTAMEWMKYRLSFCTEIDQVVVSTADTEENDPIEEMAQELALPCYRGSEHDLVDRLYQTAQVFDAGAIVRITADCPLVDPDIIDALVRIYRQDEEAYDHITNNFPPSYPHGLDAEVMPIRTLQHLHDTVTSPLYREWLTTTILEHPESYRIYNMSLGTDMTHIRITVDYQEDLTLLDRVFSLLHTDGHIFGYKEIIFLFDEQPELLRINEKRVDHTTESNIRSAEFHERKKNQLHNA